jgi:hypothetical protein
VNVHALPAAADRDYEWPLTGGREPEAERMPPSAPLNFYALVAEIRKSEAVEAFARRRAGQIIHTGHTPESDLEKGIGQIASEAQVPARGAA